MNIQRLLNRKEVGNNPHFLAEEQLTNLMAIDSYT